ncbi:MAG: nitroreductase family protein [Bacteroidota bacterium]|nr:nitroreductase family protein [Bacteroidota bacterium]
MSIPTSRFKDSANIYLDIDKCTGCGLCVEVCENSGFTLVNQKVERSDKSIFGCVACGHCMMVCPADVIAIEGRSLAPVQLFELPDKSTVPTYQDLLAMLQRRRSIREFKEKPVEPEKINQILEAAQTAPMGIPPSDVHVLVLENKQMVRSFAVEFSNYLNGIRWMASNWFLRLMRPFWSKATNEMMQGFIKPTFDIYVNEMNKGNNWINYDAPLAMYFYGSPYSDPADPIVAATYAMLAGESLGLGTCMLGGQHPFFQHGKKARLFRKKWGIKYPSREGLFVIFGYTDIIYSKGVKRSFADIHRMS